MADTLNAMAKAVTGGRPPSQVPPYTHDTVRELAAELIETTYTHMAAVTEMNKLDVHEAGTTPCLQLTGLVSGAASAMELAAKAMRQIHESVLCAMLADAERRWLCL